MNGFFRSHARPFALLLALLGLLYFWRLGDHGLLEPDEGRYSEIPREMLATGDWVTPRLNGVKYFEKPVLYYWMSALSLRTLGETELAARAVPALSALGGAALTYVAAAPHGPRGAFLSGLMVGTSLVWFALAHITLTDMALATFLTLAFYGLYRGVTGNRRWLLAGYAGMALALLTKGLIGVVLPGMVGVAWALGTRRWSLLWRAFSLPGILVFLALAGPWFALVMLRNPDFAWFFFVHEHFLRYATLNANRYQPGWFFLPILLLGFLPWTGNLLQGLRDGLAALRGLGADRRLREDDEAPAGPGEEALFLLLWAGVVLLFFSVSKSKLVPYILPVFPPLGVLAGTALDRILADRDRRRLLWGLAGNGAVCLLLGAALLLYPHHQDRFAPEVLAPVSLPLAAVLGAVGILPFLAGLRRKIGGAVLLLCLGSLAMGITFKGLFDFYGQIRSAKGVAAIVARHATPDAVVADYRDYDQGLAFYLKRRITLVNDPGGFGELSFGQRAENPDWFVTPEEFARIWRGPKPVLAVADPEKLEEFRRMGLTFRVLGSDPLYYGKTVVTNQKTEALP
ncbi:glycosyltransferase family 39 protein [Aminomonas paucivorans]|uniref:glycosyltransferase family 39 protein n=1 Tax=Aminomonas paucivorans TaxID=81412 RepID=UPI00332718B5